MIFKPGNLDRIFCVSYLLSSACFEAFDIARNFFNSFLVSFRSGKSSSRKGFLAIINDLCTKLIVNYFMTYHLIADNSSVMVELVELDRQFQQLLKQVASMTQQIDYVHLYMVALIPSPFIEYFFFEILNKNH